VLRVLGYPRGMFDFVEGVIAGTSAPPPTPSPWSPTDIPRSAWPPKAERYDPGDDEAGPPLNEKDVAAPTRPSVIPLHTKEAAMTLASIIDVWAVLWVLIAAGVAGPGFGAGGRCRRQPGSSPSAHSWLPRKTLSCSSKWHPPGRITLASATA
jgi:hypothetical protein